MHPPVPRPVGPGSMPDLGLDPPGLATPDIGAKPVPLPKPAPGGGDNPLPPDPAPRDDEGTACPAQQNDIPNGANESGDENEYAKSLLINPESPTPKQSKATPNVTSQAYFLPSDNPSGRISFDDCKQRNTPTVLPIPDLKPGAMFEHKAEGWGFVLTSPRIADTISSTARFRVKTQP